MPKFAKPEEIQYAHSVLLKGKPYFETDKIDIIECNESRDVKACPGSGKTTTLLAKLIILANRMPLPNNQGICVLTHTNVGIDEIKNKLGHKADILFRYPNHFGTIQSFVDKFLAIPYFSMTYGRRPSQVSDDAYLKSLHRSYWGAFARIKKQNENSSKRLAYFFQANDGLLQRIRLTLVNGQLEILDLKHNTIVKFNKPRGRSKNYIDWDVAEKQELKDVCMGILQNIRGYYSALSYHDAYTCAFSYLSRNPDVKSAISARFKYLFIDEMQDTDQHQTDIIKAVFDSEKTIIQCFGDHHQAIFNKIKSDEIWQPVNPLEINGSKRFGENIAKILRSVCLEKNDVLVANPSISSLSPIIIVFDNPSTVLPKFCELIQAKEIASQTIWDKAKEEMIITGNFSHKIKAIGWVGSPNDSTKLADSLTIKSYFPTFNKNVKKKEKVDYDSLKSFLRRQDGSTVKDYSNKIIEVLLHVLLTANKKYSNGKTKRNYTKTSLLECYASKSLEEFRLFNANVAKWAKNTHNSEGFCNTTIDEVRLFITSRFCKTFEVDSTNKYIVQFLTNQPTNISTADEIKDNNVFNHNGIEIEVATIHSVKGETHTATLYLETSYQGEHESQRITEQLKGVYYVPSRKKDVFKKETLKMAHVGMSRPKYLLCMAIHRSRLDSSLDINNGGMWEIVNA